MSTTLAPSVTTRDPKGLKFVSVVEAAYNKAGLSEEEAQRVNDTPGLAELVRSFIAESRKANRFVDEEVASNYTYPDGYKGPKPLSQQIDALAKIFDLDPSPALEFAKNLPVIPEGAEVGWFAIPRWETIAPTYGEAVQKVFDMIMIKKTWNGKFFNYRDGKLGPQYLRQSAKSVTAFRKFGDEQKDHDILVVAAQFGLSHKGRSVRRAREVMNTSEFGLGAFAVGIMLLTHPERLQHYDDLWIDCAGDEFSSDADGQFGHAPCFDFSGDRVRFASGGVAHASGRYGSASASVPQ